LSFEQKYASSAQDGAPVNSNGLQGPCFRISQSNLRVCPPRPLCAAFELADHSWLVTFRQPGEKSPWAHAPRAFAPAPEYPWADKSIRPRGSGSAHRIHAWSFFVDEAEPMHAAHCPSCHLPAATLSLPVLRFSFFNGNVHLPSIRCPGDHLVSIFPRAIERQEQRARKSLQNPF